MFLKNWPYWVKAGVILDLIMIIIFLISSYVEGVIINWIPVVALIILLPGALLIPVFTLGTCRFEIMGSIGQSCFLDTRNTFPIAIAIISLIFYFLVGAIAAIFYKKLKEIVFKK